MKRMVFWISAGLIVLPGCSQERGAPQSKQLPPAQASSGKSDPFTAVLGTVKPEKAASVRDVLKLKEGETVTVVGRTPPENVKPFNAALAAVVIMDPLDLDRENVKEEFDCDDAAT